MRGSARALTALAILIALWAIASEIANTPLAPGPVDVAKALAGALRDGTLARAVLTSGARLVAGYTVALVLGVPLGVALARSALTRDAIGPLVLGLSSVPSICWLPLAILWFGLSEWAIQVVVVLGAALPVAVATESAVRHVPPGIERAAAHDGRTGAAPHADRDAAGPRCPGSSPAPRSGGRSRCGHSWPASCSSSPAGWGRSWRPVGI